MVYLLQPIDNVYAPDLFSNACNPDGYGMSREPKDCEEARLVDDLIFQCAMSHPTGQEHQAVIEDCDKVLDIDPNNWLASIVKGNALYNLGRYPEAIEVIDNILAIDPDDPENRVFLNQKGLIFDNLGRYPEAIEQYDKAFALDPNTESLNNKGVSLYNLGRYPEAIEQYDKAFAFNNFVEENNIYDEWIILREDDILINKGAALTALGRYDEAIEQYDKVLADDPNNEKALNNKGNALSALGRYDEAIEQYDKVVDNSSEIGKEEDNETEIGTQIRVGFDLSSLQSDIQQQSSKKHKMDSKFIYDLIKSSTNLKEYTQDIEYFLKDIEIGHSYISLVTSRSFNDVYENKEFNGLKYVGFSIGPENLSTEDKKNINKGIVLYKIERYNDAIELFNIVLAKYPEYAPGLYNKGRCLEALGNTDESVLMISLAHEKDPNYKGERIDVVINLLPLQQLIQGRK